MITKQNPGWRAGADSNSIKPSHCRPNHQAAQQSKCQTLDYSGINAAALRAFPSVLRRLLPSGKAEHREWVALNPRRADRHLGSFRVNRHSGRWADFATGDRGGDVISLVSYLHGVSQPDAARLLSRMLGLDCEVRHD